LSSAPQKNPAHRDAGEGPFYWEGIASEGLGAPFIRLNGGAVGVSRTGGAFYRDVPPGHYHVSADSYLADVNQTVDVDLAAGQQAYFKILPELVSCGSGGERGGGGCERQKLLRLDDAA
jgi:hypothetical protein